MDRISETDFANLPEDPGLAFVQLEAIFRDDLNQYLSTSPQEHEGNEYADAVVDYFNYTLSAAKALGLTEFKDWSIPSDDDEEDYETQLSDFRRDVDAFVIQVRIQCARHTKRYSVSFDQSSKAKIRHHIDQVREIIDNSEIDIRKKESLYSKINALINEVDRDRTRFDALIALVLDVSTVTGEVATKLKPAVELVTKIFGAEKEAEDSKPLLTPPPEIKRLSPPRDSKVKKKTSKRRK